MDFLYRFAAEDQFQGFLDNAQTWFSEHGLNILFIISGSWLIGKIAIAVVHGVLINAMKEHYFKSDSDRKKRADTLHGLISAVIKIAVLLVATAMIIDELGINTAPLLASAGVMGVALGIGAQSFIKDFVSGIFIISENQFRVGDVVELEAGAAAPVSGSVESITIRTTILRDINGIRHHIPNGNITIASNSTIGFSLINETLVVDQSTDLQKLTDIINQIGAEMSKDPSTGPFIKEQLNMAQIAGYNERGITVSIRGKTAPGKQWAIKAEFYSRLQPELKKAKIKVPVAPVLAGQGK